MIANEENYSSLSHDAWREGGGGGGIETQFEVGLPVSNTGINGESV